MTSIQLLLDLLEGKTKKTVPAPSTVKNYVNESLFATGVKSLDSRLKLQLCTARGGWRSIQVYVVINGRKVVVLESAEVHSSVYPHGPLGFEVPYVQTVADALSKILGSGPQSWKIATEYSSDSRSGVDVTAL